MSRRGGQKQPKFKPRKPILHYSRHKSFTDPMKITKISGIGKISSWLEISVEQADIRASKQTGKTFYSFLFSNGLQRKISAISYEPFGLVWYNGLEVGNKFAIRGNIEVRKLDPRYDKIKVSTSPFKLFLDRCIEIRNLSVCQPKNTVTKVNEKVLKGKPFTCTLEKVEIVNGTLYRYMGCENCTTRIRYPENNGKFMCPKCPKKSVPKQRKQCMMVYNFTLKDATGVLYDVKGFNKLLITLLGKESQNFEDDTKAQDALECLFGATVNVTLKAAKNKNTLEIDIVCTACTVASAAIGTDNSGPSTSSNILSPSNQNIIGRDDANPPEPSSGGENFKLPKIRPLLESEIIVDKSTNELTGKRSPVIYPLTSKPKGLALVINNHYFPGYTENRGGSEMDFRNLKVLLPKLGHEVFEGGNWDVKSSELQSIISRFQEELDRRDVSSCIVVIMSHGSSNQIEMVDGKNINLWNDLVYKFSDDLFPRFGGKPKIFFVQGCQGFVDYEIKTKPYHVSPPDILVVQSSLPGHLSYRDLDFGTPFIYCLIQMLMNMANGTKLVEILESVQMEMRSINPRQICTWQSFLFADFYFFPAAILAESGPLLTNEGDETLGFCAMDVDAS